MRKNKYTWSETIEQAKSHISWCETITQEYLNKHDFDPLVILSGGTTKEEKLYCFCNEIVNKYEKMLSDIYDDFESNINKYL